MSDWNELKRRRVGRGAHAARRAAGLLAAFALAASGAGGVAQGQAINCQDPGCERKLSASCLDRVGAGAISTGDSCEAENNAYVTCLQKVAEQCGGGVGAGGGQAGCSPADARAEWALLRNSKDVSQLQVLAEFCKNTLQGRLAAARAEKLKEAASRANTPPAPTPTVTTPPPASGGGAQSAGGGQPGAPALNAPSFAGPIPSESVTFAELREAQSHLNRAGYAAGTADGVWGPNSEAAMRRFQRRVGLPVTGELDLRSLQALRRAPTAQTAAAGGGGGEAQINSGRANCAVSDRVSYDLGAWVMMITRKGADRWLTFALDGRESLSDFRGVSYLERSNGWAMFRDSSGREKIAYFTSTSDKSSYLKGMRFSRLPRARTACASYRFGEHVVRIGSSQIEIRYKDGTKKMTVLNRRANGSASIRQRNVRFR